MLRRVCGVFAAINQMLLSLFSMVFIVGSLPTFWVYLYGLFVTGNLSLQLSWVRPTVL